MRVSKTLARLRAGEPVRMCSLGHFIPAYIRHAAHQGFDCIWLDLEHRAMTDREVQALLAYFHLYDIDCMLRPATLEKTRLYRYLEDGATGLMIPHVSTAEKARQLVDSIKFPPLGDRGLDGAGLDSDFYTNPVDQYVDHANRETFLVVQIETPEAVRNAEQIAAVAGVDAMFIGPGDLGMRLRRMADPPFDLDEARRIVAAAARQHGKAWGCPASGDQLESLYREGGQLLAHGGDYMAFMGMLQEHGERMRAVYGK